MPEYAIPTVAEIIARYSVTPPSWEKLREEVGSPITRIGPSGGKEDVHVYLVEFRYELSSPDVYCSLHEALTSPGSAAKLQFNEIGMQSGYISLEGAVQIATVISGQTTQGAELTLRYGGATWTPKLDKTGRYSESIRLQKGHDYVYARVSLPSSVLGSEKKRIYKKIDIYTSREDVSSEEEFAGALYGSMTVRSSQVIESSAQTASPDSSEVVVVPKPPTLEEQSAPRPASPTRAPGKQTVISGKLAEGTRLTFKYAGRIIGTVLVGPSGEYRQEVELEAGSDFVFVKVEVPGGVTGGSVAYAKVNVRTHEEFIVPQSEFGGD